MADRVGHDVTAGCGGYNEEISRLAALARNDRRRVRGGHGRRLMVCSGSRRRIRGCSGLLFRGVGCRMGLCSGRSCVCLRSWDRCGVIVFRSRIRDCIGVVSWVQWFRIVVVRFGCLGVSRCPAVPGARQSRQAGQSRRLLFSGDVLLLIWLFRVRWRFLGWICLLF